MAFPHLGRIAAAPLCVCARAPARHFASAPPPILDRYRDRLARKARDEGIADVDTLRSAYVAKIDEVRRRDAEVLPHLPRPPRPPTSSTPLASPNRAAQQSGHSGSWPAAAAVKPLSALLDLDKVRTLPNAELEAVWRLRHASRPRSLCAVVPGPAYRAMAALARTAPQFVLPVPHEGEREAGKGGVELHFLQWTFAAAAAATPATHTSTVLFASLAEYKARAEFAQPHTTLTHHLDLLADRDVVLMEGAVVEGRGASVPQAQWLAMCLQRFYGGAAAGGRQEPGCLVEWFARGDERFSVEALVEEAQRVG